MIGPNSIYAQWYQDTESGSTTSITTFDLGTIREYPTIPLTPGIILSNGIFDPEPDPGGSGLYLNQYWLRIMTAGSNQGYYPITSSTGNVVTIDSTGSYGALTSGVSSLTARIYRFRRGDGTAIVNPGNDIQVDLQSGRYHANVFIHAWPSYWNDNKLHTFKITPYYLISSELDSSGIVPVWSFKCKSIVQQINQTLENVEFSNYWGNFS